MDATSTSTIRLASRSALVGYVILVMLTSCAEKPTITKPVLSPEQLARRRELLVQMLNPESLKGLHYEASEFVGHNVDGYQELIALADFIRVTGDETEYRFDMEGVAENHEGWGTFVIRAKGDQITEAIVYYPQW